MSRQNTGSELAIIIIDDDDEHLHLMQRALKSQVAENAFSVPKQVYAFNDPMDALASMPPVERMVVLCDYQMPGGNGIDWMPDLKRVCTGPIIMMTSHGDQHIATSAFKAGASDYLVKSDVFKNPQILHNAIRDALRRHRLEIRNVEMARDLKRANLALEKKNRRLNEMTEKAQQFVEDVAHEFRTPLTVIKEFASIINDGLGGPVTEKQVDYLKYIDSGVRDLTELVNDFLDSSKLRSCTLRVDRQTHTVESLFESIRHMVATRASEKQIVINEQIEKDLPQVYCDIEKAGRVMINLIINAIKFSPEESTIQLWAKPNEHGDVQIGITDQGPGLDEAQLEKLCHRFQQADNAQQSSAKGFGLGLNIASDMIRLNLGSMSIESKVGEGSTFSFSLPYFDPTHLVTRYVDVMTDDDEDTSLSLLRVSLPNSEKFTPEMKKIIADSSYSMDLMVESMDSNNLLLVGVSNQPDKWVSKMTDKWQLALNKKNATITSQAIDVRWIGTWNCPAMKDALIASVTDHIMSIRACA